MTAVEVVFTTDAREPEPLTAAELDFRDLASNPTRRAEFHQWSKSVCLAWERENVLWLHGYRDGKPIWRRERPPPEQQAVASNGKADQQLERFRFAQDARASELDEERPTKARRVHDRTKEARTQAHSR